MTHINTERQRLLALLAGILVAGAFSVCLAAPGNAIIGRRPEPRADRERGSPSLATVPPAASRSPARRQTVKPRSTGG
jgi:hypothetical protein